MLKISGFLNTILERLWIDSQSKRYIQPLALVAVSILVKIGVVADDRIVPLAFEKA